MSTLRAVSAPVRLAALTAASALLILTLSACSRQPESLPRSGAVQPAPAAATTPAAGPRSDTLITADVKTSLLADDSVKGLDISVTTDGGEVRLSGTVDNQAQRDQALVLTRRIDGVRQVRDETTLRN